MTNLGFVLPTTLPRITTFNKYSRAISITQQIANWINKPGRTLIAGGENL